MDELQKERKLFDAILFWNPSIRTMERLKVLIDRRIETKRRMRDGLEYGSLAGTDDKTKLA